MIKGIEILWKEVGKDLEQGQLSTITTVWSQRKIPEAFPTKKQTGWSLHQQHKWEWLCTIQSHTTQCHPDPRASIADLQQWASALSSPAAKQLVTTSSLCHLMKELCQTLNSSWPPFSPKQREKQHVRALAQTLLMFYTIPQTAWKSELTSSGPSSNSRVSSSSVFFSATGEDPLLFLDSGSSGSFTCLWTKNRKE